jgi:CSLREA domain-containing protein
VRRCLTLAGLLTALAAAPAGADTTFTVTKTADTNDGSCLPGNCSLRDAVTAANADADASTINLPAGHYTLTGAAGEDMNATGDLDVTHDLTVIGAGAASTVIDGGLNDRIFDVKGTTTHFTVSGVTLTRGSEITGSAINTVGSGLTLDHVNVTDNVAKGSTYGFGAVAGNSTGDATLTITDSTFTGNISGGNTYGGYGIVPFGASGDLTVSVTRSRFASNRMGGDGTTGAFGEGLFRLDSSKNGSITVEDSSFVGNTMGGGAPSSAGYGILEVYSSMALNLAVTNSTFSGNSSGGGGTASGGIGPIYYVGGSSGSTLTVSGSTFSGNTVGGNGSDGKGGGIYATPSGDTTVTVTNSTITGNSVGGGAMTATGDGGGIYMVPSGGFTLDVGLSNVTVAGNSTGGGGALGHGGGYFTSGTVNTQVSNSIIADNVAAGAANNCSLPVTSSNHSIENGTTCGFGGAGDQNAEPLLAPLGDFGGSTQTRPLLPGSPAIDHGAGCPTADQRGQPRPFGAACDVGAYEFAPPTPTTGGATQIKQKSALLGGSLVPSLRTASFHFEYGKTTAYGSQSASQVANGLAAVGASALIGGLKPGTRYHYRLVATGDATVAGKDATFKTARVSLSKLRLSPSRFRAAPKGGSIARKRKTGTNIAYRVSSSSKTTFRVLKPAAGRRVGKKCRKPSARNRRGRKCTRFVSLGKFSHKDKAGKNKLHFTGRVHRHALAPGKYRLRATPRASGVNGKPRTARFKVVP